MRFFWSGEVSQERQNELYQIVVKKLIQVGLLTA
jgi:hypothetical protein